MNIYIPFTKLRAETYAAIPEAILVPLLDRVYDYGQYFKERWNERESFISVEHDVVASPQLLSEMKGCGSTVCFASYTYPGQPERLERGTYLGCVKISKEFINKNPNLFDKPVDWHTPEGLICNASTPCHHDSVLHLHVDSRWPIEEVNRYG